ncbi:MAG: OmpH family outer membrane protein [Flavobacteriales bacterium]|nr:MAG: OmpH family outer membrane protein [Flavobacteriales bacterium]
MYLSVQTHSNQPKTQYPTTKSGGASVLLAIVVLLGLLHPVRIFAQQQRIAIVDTEKILRRIPEYNSAQKELDQLSGNWEGEVEALMMEAQALAKSYRAEKVLLTEEMRREREEAIAKKEKEARELQRKYFGPKGELFQKRMEMVKPIQDQVYNAIQDVALQRKYDLVLDRANALTILYVSEKMDISDEVLAKLGYR